MGIMDKIKNSFGGKKEEIEYEAPRRIEPREPVEEDDTGQRWKTAKKWREDKAMEEPLVKRSDFKRRI